jgi:hypothetical protein
VPPPARDVLVPPVLIAPRLEQEIDIKDSASPVALAWKGAPGSASYRVVVSASADLLKPAVERQGVSGPTLEVRGLAEGRYYWRVEAVARDGARSPSTKGSFMLRRPAREEGHVPEATPEPTLRAEPATVALPPPDLTPKAVEPTPSVEPPTPVPSPPAEAGERALIQEVLERYRMAIQARDVAALKRIWPDMPGSIERTIRESFRFAQSHRVDLRLTELALSGGAATALCDRTDEIVSNDGQRLHNAGSARFLLRKSGGAWLIQAIN